jgi:hypothetical protein
MADTLDAPEDHPVADITVAGTDLTFVGPHPEKADPERPPETWGEWLEKVIGA